MTDASSIGTKGFPLKAMKYRAYQKTMAKVDAKGC